MNLVGTPTPVQSYGDQIERNKCIVIDFIKKAVEVGDTRGAASLLADDYIQHNPIIPDGKDGFVDYFLKLRQMFPAVTGKIRRIVAEGDIVVVHMHAIREPGDAGLAIVDIFRLVDSQIAEHWEVRQPVVQSELHGNSMI